VSHLLSSKKEIRICFRRCQQWNSQEHFRKMSGFSSSAFSKNVFQTWLWGVLHGLFPSDSRSSL